MAAFSLNPVSSSAVAGFAVASADLISVVAGSAVASADLISVVADSAVASADLISAASAESAYSAAACNLRSSYSCAWPSRSSCDVCDAWSVPSYCV